VFFEARDAERNLELAADLVVGGGGGGESGYLLLVRVEAEGSICFELRRK
jgi:hypothetical protein